MLFRKNGDLVIVIALTNIAVVASGTGLVPWLALPLVLILPGYALMSALFPASRLRSPQYLVCTVALSLILTVLCGLMINLSRQGLQSLTWLLAFYALTFGLCIMGFFRRMGRSQLPPTHILNIPPVTLRSLSLLSLAAILAVVAIKISTESATQPPTSFAQLWMLPKGNSPTRTVEIGIQQIGSQPGVYDLVLVHGQDVLQRWSSLSLEPNTEWTTQISVPPQISGEWLEVMLYRFDSANTVYRQVKVWAGPGQ